MLRRKACATMLGACLLVGVVGASRPADARTVVDERYSTDRTWNSLIRLLRVDLGLSITERDREAGFVMFQYAEGRRQTSGTIELIPDPIPGVSSSRIVVQVPQMPTYVETHLARRLSQKLREDYGAPPAQEPRSPTTPPTPRQPATPGTGSGAEQEGRREGETTNPGERSGS